MSKRILLVAICCVGITHAALAKKFTRNVQVKARLGYNIGGTAPIDMPASIRKLNSYTLQFNPSIGFDLIRSLPQHWAVSAGVRLENKGMHEDAQVKNYHEEIVRGSERLSGVFTGDVTTKVKMWMITIPVRANYQLNRQVSVHAGPYLSILGSKSFSGYAHNGYLRVGDPTGDKVILGDEESTRGSYNFSDHLRKFQWGLSVGVDWTLYHRWGVYADINWGLNAIHKSEFKTIEQKLYPIFGTLGIAYKIK